MINLLRVLFGTLKAHRRRQSRVRLMSRPDCGTGSNVSTTEKRPSSLACLAPKRTRARAAFHHLRVRPCLIATVVNNAS